MDPRCKILIVMVRISLSKCYFLIYDCHVRGVILTECSLLLYNAGEN